MVVIMMCASPLDASTCDGVVRTANTFLIVEASTVQVQRDLDGIGMQNFFIRYKCFEMEERSIQTIN